MKEKLYNVIDMNDGVVLFVGSYDDCVEYCQKSSSAETMHIQQVPRVSLIDEDEAYVILLSEWEADLLDHQEEYDDDHWDDDPDEAWPYLY